MTSLNYINENDKWEFDQNVTNCFDDMLERSIPQYHVMRDAVFELGSNILEGFQIKNMLDIGCSNGINLERFIHKFGATARFCGLDVSEPMLEEARKRFKGYIDCNLVNIRNMDLRTNFPSDIYQLVTSILTIQFVPIEYRQQIIQSIYNSLDTNGGFIFVEKVLGNCSQLNELMINNYLKLKESNGYSKEQILRKKIALEGVLVPVTSAWNFDLLKQAGFRKIDSFWRWMNFEGYIAIK